MNVAGLALRVATTADAPAIQAVLEADPATYALLEGAPPRPDEALQLLAERPPGVGPEAKRVFVADGVCVLDLVRGFPTPTTWYIGLVFVAPAHRGAGLGARVLAAAAAHAAAHGATGLRLAVVMENVGARRLYDRLGYAVVRRATRATWAGGRQELEVRELAL